MKVCWVKSGVTHLRHTCVRGINAEGMAGAGRGMGGQDGDQGKVLPLEGGISPEKLPREW